MWAAKGLQVQDEPMFLGVNVAVFQVSSYDDDNNCYDDDYNDNRDNPDNDNDVLKM